MENSNGSIRTKNDPNPRDGGTNSSPISVRGNLNVNTRPGSVGVSTSQRTGPSRISDVKMSKKIKYWSIYYTQVELNLQITSSGSGNRVKRIKFDDREFVRKQETKGSSAGNKKWGMKANERRVSFVCANSSQLGECGKKCPARIDQFTFEDGGVKYRVFRRKHSLECENFQSIQYDENKMKMRISLFLRKRAAKLQLPQELVSKRRSGLSEHELPRRRARKKKKKKKRSKPRTTSVNNFPQGPILKPIISSNLKRRRIRENNKLKKLSSIFPKSTYIFHKEEEEEEMKKQTIQIPKLLPMLPKVKKIEYPRLPSHIPLYIPPRPHPINKGSIVPPPPPPVPKDQNENQKPQPMERNYHISTSVLGKRKREQTLGENNIMNLMNYPFLFQPQQQPKKKKKKKIEDLLYDQLPKVLLTVDRDPNKKFIFPEPQNNNNQNPFSSASSSSTAIPQKKEDESVWIKFDEEKKDGM